MDCALHCSDCMTHWVCDNIGEERRFLIEAAEDQLTDHQAKVEVECGESQLVGHFSLKCKTKSHKQTINEFRHIQFQAVCLHECKLIMDIVYCRRILPFPKKCNVFFICLFAIFFMILMSAWMSFRKGRGNTDITAIYTALKLVSSKLKCKFTGNNS